MQADSHQRIILLEIMVGALVWKNAKYRRIVDLTKIPLFFGEDPYGDVAISEPAQKESAIQ